MSYLSRVAPAFVAPPVRGTSVAPASRARDAEAGARA